MTIYQSKNAKEALEHFNAIKSLIKKKIRIKNLKALYPEAIKEIVECVSEIKDHLEKEILIYELFEKDEVE